MHLCVLAVTYSSPRAPHLQGELAKDEKMDQMVIRGNGSKVFKALL